MKILGIETSCDETAASIAEGKGDKVKILSNIISSQIEIHKKWGGVVPEVAAREHLLNILPVIKEAMEKADIKSPKSIDAIAVTAGPGLITSLITGVETAKTLSFAWQKPLISVNHIESHVYANFLDGTQMNFPALILTVSGGHNMLVLMKDHGKYQIIGKTRDDAAGEAFDKAAQILGLGYPGGPAIAEAASKCKTKNQDISLPRPMFNSSGYDFSFSGLKTALLYAAKKDKNLEQRKNQYACEFQQAIIDVLIKKTIKAAQKYNVKTIALSGGVSANKELRKQLEETAQLKIPGITMAIPALKYTTDNAAMVAGAGFFLARQKKYISWKKIKTNCNLAIK
jgi:N6-L-threonylcarbamoyladenine synthase